MSEDVVQPMDKSELDGRFARALTVLFKARFQALEEGIPETKKPEILRILDEIETWSVTPS